MLYKHLWERYLDTPELDIPELINNVVSQYANGNVKVHYVSPKGGDLGSIAPEEDIQSDWDHKYGVYDHTRKAIILNKDSLPVDNIFYLFQILLHEIKHFNQHLEWEKLSPQAKIKTLEKMTKEKMPREMGSADFGTLLEFLLDVYGYDSSPLELEAQEFAKTHLMTALKKNIPFKQLVHLAQRKSESS